jgi:hypothetical protein
MISSCHDLAIVFINIYFKRNVGNLLIFRNVAARGMQIINSEFKDNRGTAVTF